MILRRFHNQPVMYSLLTRFFHQITTPIDAKTYDDIKNWSRNSPVFPVTASDVEVLKEPGQFYDKLLELSSTSKNRITLSALYFGTDQREQDLVSTLQKNVDHNDNLKLTILLDYHRGTRQNHGLDSISSRSFLLPLVRSGASVSFFLTPKMSGWRRWLVHRREKWNELVSLQHIKCYIFDDHMIMSGANLSDLYFTNRQDRYILFKNCKHMCDYFDDLIKTVSTFSMSLDPSGDFKLHPSWNIHPLDYFRRRRFCQKAAKRVLRLKQVYSNQNHKPLDKTINTIAIPLLQLKMFGIDDDENFTINLLKNTDLQLKLATGYFNLTKQYKRILLDRQNDHKCDILFASEQANGFFGAKGLVGQIPFVYTDLTRRFWKQTKLINPNIRLSSYHRPNWTFHAKGLWLSPAPNHLMTMIGSPNFGFRSVYRDTEAQLVLLTTDAGLKRKLEDESDHLWRHSTEIVDQKQFMAVPFWVSLIARLFKSYY